MVDEISSNNGDYTVGAILVAAGRGSRFGDTRNKVFCSLLGEPIWFHAARRMRELSQVARLVIVVAAADREHWGNEASRLRSLDAELVDGGQERIESVRAGFDRLRNQPTCDLIAIHDAARPCVTREDLQSVFDSAFQSGAAILARPLTGSIKRSRGQSMIERSVDRRHLWEALTPQVFQRNVLQNAFERWRGRPLTDDAQLVELSGHPVTIVAGSVTNLKITNPNDLDLAAAILQRQK